jgi:GDPmannose 4,6-dehydratase
VTGQDGSYLIELLLDRGYDVYGIIRRSSSFNTWRIHERFQHQGAVQRFHLSYGDLSDGMNLTRLLHEIQPDLIFHLGAQSHVRISFEIPEYTGDVTGLGTLRLLESIRHAGIERSARFYQASSSEMFGSAPPPQSETTPFEPRSPYACAKAYAYYITKNYRESYGMFASNGILFNHESPRRGENFVTRKITLNLARIKHGLADRLVLGNLDARRDWGYAKDYMEAAIAILEHHVPDDFVIATGESHTVREVAEEAARLLGMRLEWRGSGRDEAGIDANTGREIIVIDPKYFRPAEVNHLEGDAGKARCALGWEPKTSFKELIRMMIESDETDCLREIQHRAIH